MGHESLLQALRRKGEEKAREIWERAEVEAARLRAEAARQIKERRSRAGREQAEAAAEVSRSLRREAERQVQALRLEVRNVLADRLHQAAKETLVQLRGRNYPELYATLAEELPPFSWSRVRVNPADEDLARKYFPEAEIVCDPNISAGMEVEGDQGRIRLDNTLEKRLERAWERILPALLEDLFREVEGA